MPLMGFSSEFDHKEQILKIFVKNKKKIQKYWNYSLVSCNSFLMA